MKNLTFLTLTVLLAGSAILPVSQAKAMGSADESTSSTASPGHSKTVEKKLDKLTTALQLSPDEQAKIKLILEQEAAAVKAVHDNKSLSKADHAAKLKAIHADTKTKIAATLSVDQQKKFADMGPGHRSSSANKS